MMILALSKKLPDGGGTWECITFFLYMLSANVHIACSVIARFKGYPVLEIVVFPALLIIVEGIKWLRDFSKLGRGQPTTPQPPSTEMQFVC